MKLRNKKTGEICELGHIRQAWREEKDGGMGYMFLKADDNNGIIYNSLAEMMDEWEDYKPAEPLIKNEKVRNAVRAWAEANDIGIASAYVTPRCWYLRAFKDGEQGIDFWLRWGDNLGLIENKRYTIAELCGEEEECES